MEPAVFTLKIFLVLVLCTDATSQKPDNKSGDIMIAVDVSSATSVETFAEILDFSADLINLLGNFIDGNRGILLGLETFAFKRHIFGLFPSQKPRQLIAVLLDTEQQNSVSLIHAAIDEAVSALQKDGRIDSVNIIVVVTSDHELLYPRLIRRSIRLSKLADTHVIGALFGPKANLSSAKQIATNDDCAFINPDPSQLLNTIIDIIALGETNFTIDEVNMFINETEDYEYVVIDDTIHHDDGHDSRSHDPEYKDDYEEELHCDERERYIHIAIDSSETFLADEFGRQRGFTGNLIKALVNSTHDGSQLHVDVVRYSDSPDIYEFLDPVNTDSISTLLESIKHNRGGKNIVKALEYMRSRSEWIKRDVDIAFIVCTDGFMPKGNVAKIIDLSKAMITRGIAVIFVQTGFSQNNYLWKSLDDHTIPNTPSNVADVVELLNATFCGSPTKLRSKSCEQYEVDIVVVPFKSILGRNPVDISSSICRYISDIISDYKNAYQKIRVNLVLLQNHRRLPSVLGKVIYKRFSHIVKDFKVLDKDSKTISELKSLRYNNSNDVNKLYDVLGEYETYTIGQLEKISLTLLSMDRITYNVGKFDNDKSDGFVDVARKLHSEDKTALIAALRKVTGNDCYKPDTPEPDKTCGFVEVGVAVDFYKTHTFTRRNYLNQMIDSILNSNAVSFVGIYPFNLQTRKVYDWWRNSWPTLWMEDFMDTDLVGIVEKLTQILTGDDRLAGLKMAVIYLGDGTLISHAVLTEVDIASKLGVRVVIVSNGNVDTTSSHFAGHNFVIVNQETNILRVIDQALHEQCKEIRPFKRRKQLNLPSALLDIVIAIDTSETFMKADLQLEVKKVGRFIQSIFDMNLIRSILSIITFSDTSTITKIQKHNMSSSLSTFRRFRDVVLAQRLSKGGKFYRQLMKSIAKLFNDVRKPLHGYSKKLAVIFTDGMIPNRDVPPVIETSKLLQDTNVKIIWVKTGLHQPSALWNILNGAGFLTYNTVVGAMSFIKRFVLQNSLASRYFLRNKARLDFISVPVEDRYSTDISPCWFTNFDSYYTELLDLGITIRIISVADVPTTVSNLSDDKRLIFSRVSSFSFVPEKLMTGGVDTGFYDSWNYVLFIAQEEFLKHLFAIKVMFESLCKSNRVIIAYVLVTNLVPQSHVCTLFTEVMKFGHDCSMFCYTINPNNCHPRYVIYTTLDAVMTSESKQSTNEERVSSQCELLMTFALHSSNYVNAPDYLEQCYRIIRDIISEYKQCSSIKFGFLAHEKVHVFDTESPLIADNMIVMMNMSHMLKTMKKHVPNICRRHKFVIFTNFIDEQDVSDTVSQIYKVTDDNKTSEIDHDLLFAGNGTHKFDRYFTNNTAFVTTFISHSVAYKFIIEQLKTVNCHLSHTIKKGKRRSKRSFGVPYSGNLKNTSLQNCDVGVVFAAEGNKDIDSVSFFNRIFKLADDLWNYLSDKNIACNIGAGIMVNTSRSPFIALIRFRQEFLKIVNDMQHTTTYSIAGDAREKMKPFLNQCNSTVLVVFTGDRHQTASRSPIQLLMLSGKLTERLQLVLTGVNILPVFQYLASFNQCAIVHANKIFEQIQSNVMSICSISTKYYADGGDVSDSDKAGDVPVDTDGRGNLNIQTAQDCNPKLLVIDALVDNSDAITLDDVIQEIKNDYNDHDCSKVLIGKLDKNMSIGFDSVEHTKSNILSQKRQSIFLVSSLLVALKENPDMTCYHRDVLIYLHNEMTTNDQLTFDTAIHQLIETDQNVRILLMEITHKQRFLYSNVMADGRYTITNNYGFIRDWINTTFQEHCEIIEQSTQEPKLNEIVSFVNSSNSQFEGASHTVSNFTANSSIDTLEHDTGSELYYYEDDYGENSNENTENAERNTENEYACAMCIIYTGNNQHSSPEYESLKLVFEHYKNQSQCRIPMLLAYGDQHTYLKQVSFVAFMKKFTELVSPTFANLGINAKLEKIIDSQYVWECNSTILLLSDPHSYDELQWLDNNLKNLPKEYLNVISIFIAFTKDYVRNFRESDYQLTPIFVKNAFRAGNEILRVISQLCQLNNTSLNNETLQYLREFEPTDEPTLTIPTPLIPTNFTLAMYSLFFCGKNVSLVVANRDNDTVKQNDFKFVGYFNILATAVGIALNVDGGANNPTGFVFLSEGDVSSTITSLSNTNSIFVMVNVDDILEPLWTQMTTDNTTVFLDVPRWFDGHKNKTLNTRAIIVRRVVQAIDNTVDYISVVHLMLALSKRLSVCGDWEMSKLPKTPCNIHVTIAYIDKTEFNNRYKPNIIADSNEQFARLVQRQLLAYETIGIKTLLRDVNSDHSITSHQNIDSESREIYMSVMEEYTNDDEEEPQNVLIIVDAPKFNEDELGDIEYIIEDGVPIIFDIKSRKYVHFDEDIISELEVVYRQHNNRDSVESLARKILQVSENTCKTSLF